MNFSCIFDWDGVIIDSSAHHIEAWRRLAEQEKLVFPEHLFKQSFGMKNEEIIPQLWKWTNDISEIRRIDRKKESLYREIVCEKGLVALPGVKELLEQLFFRTIPCAIGSSAPIENVATGLKILGFERFFSAVVTGDDVKLGKPSPHIFLEAARRLGAAPRQCVVFEDAIVGVAAGKAAGMTVVAVTNTYPAARLSNANWVVDNLEQVNVDILEKLVLGIPRSENRDPQ